MNELFINLSKEDVILAVADLWKCDPSVIKCDVCVFSVRTSYNSYSPTIESQLVDVRELPSEINGIKLIWRTADDNSIFYVLSSFTQSFQFVANNLFQASWGGFSFYPPNGFFSKKIGFSAGWGDDDVEATGQIIYYRLSRYV